MTSMTKVPPVQENSGVYYRTYAEFSFDRNYVQWLKYRLPKKDEEKPKKDDELVKKVNAALGIGTKLDLAA